MPPRSVVCQLCGGKFFAASLAHHQKVCQKKVGKQLHECPYCKAGVPLLELDAHVLRCPEAKAAGAKPTGASAALARRLESHARGIPQGGDQCAKAQGGNGMDGVPEYADGEDLRVECQICGRKFAMDRIAKHQAICEKLTSKKLRRTFQTQREYVEGGQGGSVIGTAKHMNKPKPAPMKCDWRKQSEAWREACKSARSNPLPPWGQGSDQLRRRSQSPQPLSDSRNGGRSPVPRRAGAGSPSPVQRKPPQSLGPESRTSPVRGRVTSPAAPAPTKAPMAVSGFAAVVVKEQFRALDKNGDGRLDPEELSALLKAGDAEMTDHEIQALFDSIDKDHNGRIDFEEFVDFVFSEQGSLPLRAGAAHGRSAPRQGLPSPTSTAGGLGITASRQLPPGSALPGQGGRACGPAAAPRGNLRPVRPRA